MSKKRGVYTVGKDDTLSDIALRIYNDSSLWHTKIKKENGDKYSEAEAKKIKPDQKVYYEIPEITHKELLTFSNLTNLDWQFADLGNTTKGIRNVNGGKESSKLTKINDLLTPDSFVRRKDNPKKGQPGEPEELIEEIYGLDNNGKYLGDEAALTEMPPKDCISIGIYPLSYDIKVVDCNNYLTLNGALA